MFGEMLLLAGLRKFIERERRVIIGEFHLSYPVKFAYDLEIQKQKAVYKDTWLERFVSPLGNPESIESMTQTDLQMQYDMHYTPANMSVVGVGGIELDQLVSLLANSPFGINKQGTRTPLPTPMSVVEPLTENRYIFEFSHHVSMATPLRVGQYLSIAKLPGTIKPGLVELVEAMLDEKLMEEVRERRAWTYHIETDSYDFRYLWEFSIRCRGLEPKALDKIENVVEIALASMNEDLFEQAKHRALASSRMIDPTGNKICKGALNDLANNYRIISLAEYDTEIERITMSDIREVLKLLRPAQRYTVITKP